jgi:hypothetical protein
MQELVTLCMSGIGRLPGVFGLLSLGITLIFWGLKRRQKGAILSWRWHCLHPRWIWGLVSLLLVALLWIPQLVTAEDSVEVLTLRYEAEGPYALAAGGVGMTNSPSGDMPLDVPGTVIQAYLYWGGWDEIGDGGDNMVSLSVDGGVATPLTADETFGPAFWFGDYERYIYVEDVTSLVQAGAHTYTVSGFDASMYYRDGAGLLVVYEDPSLPWNRVEIKDGLDRFFSPWWNQPPDNPQRGETAITCFTFEAFPEDRQMDITMFVGGVDISGPDRPNALWYRTGTDAEPMPTDLIFEDSDTYDPGAVQLEGPPNYPFRSLDGEEWDTYTNSIPLSAGDTWACIQIESAEYLTYRPSSGVGMTFVASFRVAQPEETPTPTATSTETPTPTETSTGTTTPTTPTGTPTATATGTVPTATSTATATPTATSTGTTPPVERLPVGSEPPGPEPPTSTPTPIPPAPMTPTPTEVLIARLPETGGFPGWFTVVLGVTLIIGAAGLLNLFLLEMRGRRGGGKGD